MDMSVASENAMRGPERGYLLCASPRSGSTMLCDLLAQSGVAGAPQSYFRPASIPQFAQEWGLPIAREAWDKAYVDSVVRHGDAGTGCFGMRIMWSDLSSLLGRLRSLYRDAGSDVEVLRNTLGVRRFIRLSREDKVAQAVSLVLAEQTGLWHRNADGSERQRSTAPARPRYSHGQIDAALRLLDAEALGWSTWFDESEIVPLEVTYEELAATTNDGIGRVIEHVGGRCSISIDPLTSRLAAEVNDEWSTRFRRERRSKQQSS